MTEYHEYQCRQFVIPIEIVQYVEDHTITIKMAWLLAVIDALYQSKGIGCFASEEWLAERIQVKPRQLRNYVAKLVELELLIISWENGRKTLEASWSNKESAMLGKKLPDQIVNKVVTSRQKIAKTLGKKLPIYNKDNTIVVNCRPAEAGDSAHSGESSSSRGQQSSSGPPVALACAQRLYKLLLRQRSISQRNYHEIKWTTRFAQAIADHGLDQVQLALQKYEQHFGKKYMVVVLAANTFCEDIPRITNLAKHIEADEAEIAKKKKQENNVW